VRVQETCNEELPLENEIAQAKRTIFVIRSAATKARTCGYPARKISARCHQAARRVEFLAPSATNSPPQDWLELVQTAGVCYDISPL
jgi:hypothetical protein